MKKLYNYYKIFVILLTVITIFVSIITSTTNGYEFVFLIPTIYLLLFLLFKRIHIYSREYIGLMILNIIAFIKYSLSILIVVINKDFYTPTIYSTIISSNTYSKAIIYMIIELLVVFFTVELFSDSIYRREKKELNNNEKYEKFKIKPLFLIPLLIITGLIFVYPNSFFPDLSILSKDSYLVIKETDTSIIPVLFLALKTIVMCILINNCIVKFQKTNRSRYVLFSYILIMIFCFLNIGSSRRTMILPLLLFVMITLNIFKGKGKTFLISAIVILSLLFSSITVYKMFWLFKENSSFSYVFKTSLEGTQEYFSSIRPIAIGLDTLYKYDGNITIGTFINDFAGSTPFISQFINQNNRINFYYNLNAINGVNTSQIVPMIIVSKAYFGTILSGLLTFLHIIILMLIEKKLKKNNNNFLNNYLNMYLLFCFATVLNSNTQMIYSRILLNYFIPLLLLKFNSLGVGRKDETYGKI